VRIINSGLKRRLNRALHAFSPATPALFAVLGQGSRESCFEDDFGLGGVVGAEADAFIECFEAALGARGVPYAHVDEGTAGTSLGGARWILCPTAGGVEPNLWEELRWAAQGGAKITIGPRIPTRDGSLRQLPEPLDGAGFEVVPARAHHPFFDRQSADAIVDRAIADLGLRTLGGASSHAFATIHEDAKGRPRVLFLLNPSAESERAKVDLGVAVTLTDLLDESRYQAREGRITVSVPARTVRMLVIDPA
jgi:beta-galactosidase